MNRPIAVPATTISLTVNTPNQECQLDLPQRHALIQQEVYDNITAAMKLYPDWTSMVITFTNPQAQDRG